MDNVRSNKRGQEAIRTLPDNYNVNLLLQTGMYDVKNPTPTLIEGLDRVRLQVIAVADDSITQLLYADLDIDRNMIYSRSFNGTSWTNWDRMLTEGNIAEHIGNVITFNSEVPGMAIYGMNVQVTDPTEAGFEPKTFEYDNIQFEITGTSEAED